MSKHWKRAVFIVSLAGNVLWAVMALAVIHKQGGLPWLQSKAAEIFSSSKSPKPRGNYRSVRVSVFDQLPLGTNDIVFLGDSIFAFGEWHELMGNPRAKNRGVNGDDTSAVLKRLNQVIAGRPAHVVVLCGINDFQNCIPFKQTTNDYARIVDRLVSGSAGTHIWLIPVFPVHPDLYRRWIIPDHPSIHMPEQSEVERLNDFIQQLAASGPHPVHYVPVPTVLDSSGHLHEDFTFDGLHLNGRGLSEVAKQIKAAME